jgi:hypothetical protein
LYDILAKMGLNMMGDDIAFATILILNSEAWELEIFTWMLSIKSIFT